MPVGLGTTSVSSTSSSASESISSVLGLTTGGNTSSSIIRSLKDDKQQKIQQKDGINDILLLTDVTIDGYDKLIINMDKPIIPLLNEINVAITSVKNAYDARVTANCLSDLKWTKVSSTTRSSFYKGFTSNITYETWEVTKDSSQYNQINYYGFKYYKYPHNRDYGYSAVQGISNASVGIGSTYMIVFDSNGISGITTGDTISDKLENPTIFAIGNLPEVVSFGSTSIIGIAKSFEGSITIGSTILAHTGSGIVTSGISTGDYIIRSGVTSENSTVVGFGTVTADLTVIDASGITTTISATVDTVILSKPAIATTSVSTFNVGIASTYPTIFISTTTNVGGINTNFVVIRSDPNQDNFNYSVSGVDPVEIGLIKDDNKVGYGHTAILVNNGSPDIVANWREVIDPEPAVGAGYAPYYVGAASWPGFNSPIMGGVGGTSIVGYAFTYASLGQRVTIGYGSTTVQVALATTATKPPGAPSDSTCTNTYTANISSAESSLSSLISTKIGICTYYANSSEVLRQIRDDKENFAWSLARGKYSLKEEIDKLTSQIATLENIDFREFE
jgi:hypothetical protein